MLALSATVSARLRSTVLAVGAVLALSACAETEFLVHTAKQLRGGDVKQSEGRYKVGAPYQINGAWYYPAEDFEYSETGIASWYGPNFHGKKTANGEDYNQNDLTAAHRTLPMPSAVRVTNLENGRSLVLRINDRGPFARGRIIDVSRRGAQLLGFEKNGVAKVRVDILPNESRQLKLAAINGSEQQVQVTASPREAVVAKPLPSSEQPLARASSERAPHPVRMETVPQPVEPVLSEKVDVLPVSPTGIYVQAGAFSRLENALRMRDQLFEMGPTQISRFAVSGTEVYRVRIGPLANVELADATLARVVSSGVNQAQLIVE